MNPRTHAFGSGSSDAVPMANRHKIIRCTNASSRRSASDCCMNPFPYRAAARSVAFPRLTLRHMPRMSGRRGAWPHVSPVHQQHHAMSGRSTQMMGTNFVHPLTERDAAERFSAAIIRFQSGQLAQASCRTKDAAKSWKAGRRCPNGSSLINLARAIPAVRAWLYAEIECFEVRS